MPDEQSKPRLRFTWQSIPTWLLVLAGVLLAFILEGPLLDGAIWIAGRLFPDLAFKRLW
jgi:hypothetical protein